MPVNYYIGRTEDELLEMLKAAQQRGTTGTPSFTSFAAGMQTQRSFQNSDSIELTIRRILYALHVLNPSEYDNPELSRVRRTTANYTC